MDYLKNKKTLDLNGDWSLSYTKENLPVSTRVELKALSTLEKWAELFFEKPYDLQTIDAKVPGNFEIDLERAGVIGDLFKGMATRDNQKWEIYYK